MAVTSGKNFGNEILKKMGIDVQDVVGFELRCYANEIVTIKLERFVKKAEMEEAETVLENYRLLKIKEPE